MSVALALPGTWCWGCQEHPGRGAEALAAWSWWRGELGYSLSLERGAGGKEEAKGRDGGWSWAGCCGVRGDFVSF